MAATAVGLIWRGEGANTNPTASAPIATAINASSSLVMPQIFTHTGRPAQAAPRRRPSGQPSARAPRRPARRRTRVSRARRRPPRLATPDSAILTTPAGIWPTSRAAALPVDLEGVQIPLVDAHQLSADPDGPLELGLVVDLHESRHAELDGEPVQLRQLRSLENGHDEQHGIRAHDPGVEDVVRRDGEILAEHRQVDGGPGRLKIFWAAAEVGTVGKHRQAGRAARRVRPGDLGRIEIRGEVTFGRGASLDLGHEGDLFAARSGSIAGLDRLDEVPGRRR